MAVDNLPGSVEHGSANVNPGKVALIRAKLMSIVYKSMARV